MSVMLMLNEKFREGIPVWERLKSDDSEASAAKFQSFFDVVIGSQCDPARWGSFTLNERCTYILFLINTYASCFEEPMVGKAAMKLMSLPLWENLTLGRLRVELTEFPQLLRHWQHLQAKKKSESAGERCLASCVYTFPDMYLVDAQNAEAKFIPALVNSFLDTVASISDDVSEPVPKATLLYTQT